MRQREKESERVGKRKPGKGKDRDMRKRGKEVEVVSKREIWKGK